MRVGARRIWIAAALVVAAASPVWAQTPSVLVDRGVQAYDDLDLPAAARALREALSRQDGLSDAERIRALTYLGATEFVRGNRDSSVAVFRRLLEIAPRSELDPLVFPPEMTVLFGQVKRDARIVVMHLPDSIVLRTGSERTVARLVTSAYHRISATIRSADGTEFRRLFQGSIADSLELVWDGTSAAGEPPPDGRYSLVVESFAAGSEPVRIVRAPLNIAAEPVDTLDMPPPPADSLLLPEQTSGRRGVDALIGGVLSGVGIGLLPAALAPDADLSPARVVVAGSVTLAGVLGYVTQRSGRPILANIEANNRVRTTWRSRADDIAQENAARRSRPMLRILTGTPSAVTPGS